MNAKKQTTISCRIVKTEALADNRELLQTPFWAGIKEPFGWKGIPVGCEIDSMIYNILVLVRSISPGFSIAYIPYAPDVPEPLTGKEDLLISVGKALARILPKSVRFIRFDLLWYREGAGKLPPLLKQGRDLRKAPMDIQPPSTVLLDITGTEPEIMSQMKSKTRYNIKLAGRKGVNVASSGEDFEEDLKKWYEMYKETATRDKIVIHSFGYYKSLFESARSLKQGGIPGPGIKLLLAKVEGEVVAGIVVAVNRDRATYLYGASNNLKRNFMPNHLLQWEAIRLARDSGCTSYDFFGIPEINDPSHPMYGLYRFKTGFGGTIVNRPGCYDYTVSGFYYFFYRIAEGLRKFYYKKLRKILSRR